MSTTSTIAPAAEGHGWYAVCSCGWGTGNPFLHGSTASAAEAADRHRYFRHPEEDDRQSLSVGIRYSAPRRRR